jgi:hypothetical protein
MIDADMERYGISDNAPRRATPPEPPPAPAGPAFLCRCLPCCCPKGQGHNSPDYRELDDD